MQGLLLNIIIPKVIGYYSTFIVLNSGNLTNIHEKRRFTTNSELIKKGTLRHKLSEKMIIDGAQFKGKRKGKLTDYYKLLKPIGKGICLYIYIYIYRFVRISIHE